MSIKLLHSQVILADICIKLDNIPRALILLDEVYKKFDVGVLFFYDSLLFFATDLNIKYLLLYIYK